LTIQAFRHYFYQYYFVAAHLALIFPKTLGWRAEERRRAPVGLGQFLANAVKDTARKNASFIVVQRQ
jgi:hypothetical protein